jgi:hypothetical protein
MSADSDSGRIRMSIRVEAELKTRMDKVLKWGEFNNTMVEILQWICDMHDKYGDEAFLLFRSGKLQEFFKKEGLGKDD